MTVDLRSYDAVRPLVRARLLSEEYHDLEELVKRHLSGDVWLTFCIPVPAPGGSTVLWSVTYALQDMWGVSVDQLIEDAMLNESVKPYTQKG